jgi:hypothetical protein
MRDSHDNELSQAELEVLARKLEQQISNSKTILTEAMKQLVIVRSHLASVAQHKLKAS